MTTMSHPAQVIGHHLITQLLAAIDGSCAVPDVYLSPELVIRQTTGPVPGSTS
ncbi:MAG: hypothetical protein ACR2QK_10655 [Acidimicrobiales bacterium]